MTVTTSMRMDAETRLRLKLLKKRLRCKSMTELLTLFADTVTSMKWDRVDLECLIKFKKIPIVESGSATDEDDMLRQLDLAKSSAKKLGEVPVPDTMPTDLSGKNRGESS